MEIVINPNLYDSAQSYVKQRGLNLTRLIENYLKSILEIEDSQRQELPDAVNSLLGASGGQLDRDDLNGRQAYHSYIEEKYK